MEALTNLFLPLFCSPQHLLFLSCWVTWQLETHHVFLKIHAWEIFGSYGNPTVELYSSKDLFQVAVPSGTSVGIYEALLTTWGKVPQRLLSQSIKLLHLLWLARNWTL